MIGGGGDYSNNCATTTAPHYASLGLWHRLMVGLWLMQIRPLLGLAQGDLKSYYVILFKKVFLSFSLFCQRSINTKRVSLKMAKNGINKIGRFITFWRTPMPWTTQFWVGSEFSNWARPFREMAVQQWQFCFSFPLKRKCWLSYLFTCLPTQ